MTDDMLSLSAFRLVEKDVQSISINEGLALEPITDLGANPYTADAEATLSDILKSFNERYGTNFTKEDMNRLDQVATAYLRTKTTETKHRRGVGVCVLFMNTQTPHHCKRNASVTTRKGTTMTHQLSSEIDSLIAACFTGLWETRTSQQHWLNTQIANKGISVEEFDSHAEEWAARNNAAKDWSDRQNGSHPVRLGAYLRGV